MNIPNCITLLRIFLTPLMVILVLYRQFDKALVVFTIAALTDGLDGFIARVWKQRTLLGKILDPIADKMLLLASYVTLSMAGIVPQWLTVLVISRDVIIVTGVSLLFIFIREAVEISPSLISKFTTLLQLATIFLVLLNIRIPELKWLVESCFIAAGISTAISGIHYMYKGFNIVHTNIHKSL